MVKDIDYYLHKRYEVTTHSIAMIDHKNIDLVGIPLTEINGEVYENHSSVVETKFTIDKIIRTFKLNIPLSLRNKSRLPEYIDDFECLIVLLNSKKSRNMLEHKVTLPEHPDINLSDIITFYNTISYNNKKTFNKELTKKLENDFELLPKEMRLPNSSNYTVKTGKDFIKDLNEMVMVPETKLKKNYGGMRDEY